jgi:hypothetical protein
MRGPRTTQPLLHLLGDKTDIFFLNKNKKINAKIIRLLTELEPFTKV